MSPYRIFIEEIEDSPREAIVAPMPVYQQQSFQEPESSDSKIGRHHRLHSLLSANPDPDVGRLDHRHVVGPVPDRQRLPLHMMLYQLHDVRLKPIHQPIKLRFLSTYHKLAGI